jgi:hypothetical protein
MLWGKAAQSVATKINEANHLVLKAGHPSPLSATFFFGCKHFSQANAYLQQHNKLPINWILSDQHPLQFTFNFPTSVPLPPSKPATITPSTTPFPSAPKMETTEITPLAKVNPYMLRAVILIRVTFKSQIYHWGNTESSKQKQPNKKPGHFFFMDFMDAEKNYIRASCYNAVADKLFPLLEENKVIII